ncbi:MAG: preprotein translocase subunit SecG [Holosporaceae bacterium]|jgi:preprotein translocase subunit SecG|nr:preprotein translocase subunit SecG [Holosporaceae bacterium]
MLSFLLAVHFVLTISIIGLILLQKHDSDGALGSSGGGAASGMFSVRGQANVLTRSTAILMTIFVLNCLVMAKLVKRTPQKESIIDSVAHETVPTESGAPGVPSPDGSTTAPAAPTESTTPTNHQTHTPATPASPASKSQMI